MRKVFLAIISGYQAVVSPLLHQALGVSHACRYSPTCSEYARIHITREGVILGGIKSVLRVLYCQPFVKKLPAFLVK